MPGNCRIMRKNSLMPENGRVMRAEFINTREWYDGEGMSSVKHCE